MELEKSIQLLTSITPVSESKSKRKPKVTKLTLKNQSKKSLLLSTNSSKHIVNINNMDSNECISNSDNNISKKYILFNQDREKLYNNVHVLEVSKCSDMSSCILKTAKESTTQSNNKEKYNGFSTKLNLSYDNSDESILTNDISTGSKYSNDFKLVLTSDDSLDKHEEIENYSKNSRSDFVPNSESTKHVNQSNISSLNDFQPREIKETISSIMEDISKISDDIENIPTKHKTNIKISFFRSDIEQKTNTILVPETQDDCEKNRFIPCITVDESEDENENMKPVMNSQPVDLYSENEMSKNSIITSSTESYQTAALCKISPMKDYKYNFDTTNKEKKTSQKDYNVSKNENDLLYKNSLELIHNETHSEFDISSNLNTENCYPEQNSLSKSAEKLLDEVYGKSWRVYRDKQLSKSEIKIKKKPMQNYFNTERKPKHPEKLLIEDTSRFSTFTPDFESTRSLISDEKRDINNWKSKTSKKLFNSEHFPNKCDTHGTTNDNFKMKDSEIKIINNGLEDKSIICILESDSEYLKTPNNIDPKQLLNNLDSTKKSRNNTDKKKKKLYTPKEESKTDLILPDLTRFSYSYITNKKSNQGNKENAIKKETPSKKIVYKIPKNKKVIKCLQSDSDESSDDDLKGSIFKPLGQEVKSKKTFKVSDDNLKENTDSAKKQLGIKKNRACKNLELTKSDSSSSVQSVDDSEKDIVKNVKQKNFSKTKYGSTDNTSTCSTSNSDMSDSDYEVTKSVKCITKSTASKKLSFLASLSGGVAIAKCHFEALKYKRNFKKLKDELAKKLFNLYNSTIFDYKIPEDTQLEWNARMTGTAGYCYCKRIIKKNSETTRSCRIVLSSKVLDSPDRVRDTLLHEMCHAATWLVNGISDGHGPKWKSWAMKAVQVYPELPIIKRCHDYEIKTKYTYKCVRCGYSIGRHSKSLNTERKVCGYCNGKFELFVNKTTKDGLIKSTLATDQKMNEFAIFVKENYGSIKKDTKLKHADVMRVLSQKFSSLKVTAES